MQIKEEVNTKDETKFIFDAGNIITRNDVKFEEDAGACFDYFLDQKMSSIFQNHYSDELQQVDLN